MTDVRIITRPLDDWPREFIPEDQRRWSPFTATWTDTVDLLKREAAHLGAEQVVMHLSLTERQIRLNGQPRADATPSSPAARIVLPDVAGSPSWSCDEFNSHWTNHHTKLGGWKANVRAIALTLERLRLADLYGALRGQHYAGFKELGAGIPMGPAVMSVEEAARFIAEHAGSNEGLIGPDGRILRDRLTAMYRFVARKLHPDVGGDAALFARLQDAREVLERHG